MTHTKNPYLRFHAHGSSQLFCMKTIAPWWDQTTSSLLIGKENIRVSLPYWNGKELSGFEYVTEYLIPNFYFHVTTAYAIMRKNGVQLGKDDFIGGLPLK